MVLTDDDVERARETIRSGEFLAVERVAQNVELPKEIREEAGMAHIANSISNERWTNLLYILGSERFLQEVKLEAGYELIRADRYLELLSVGERYPERIRIDAGKRMLEIYKREENRGALEGVAYMRGHHPEIRRMALDALNTMQMIESRRAALQNLTNGKPSWGAPAAKTEPPRKI